MIQVILQSIENDEQRNAIEQIYHLYGKMMLAKAYSILNNTHDAEDAVMETFYRISKSAQDFIDPKHPATVALISIYTRNVAINMYRRNQRYSKIVHSDVDVDEVVNEAAAEDVAELIISDENMEIVRRAIHALDDMYKDVIILKYFYHKRNVEIAEILGIDSNRVNGRIYRAKQKIKEIIGEDGYARIQNR